MATKAKLTKAAKQAELISRYAAQRQILKERNDYEGLRKLPRDASPVRYKKRCRVTGRPRGYMNDFAMSRITFRTLAHQGQIPGITKASW
ncbi:30S ribosomal protein S14 [Brochothrix campestris]|uniref:30S ribosomal protein S14 n=1 Tax=Brochothrix campestris TaxID=2757 RepID=UPI0009FEDA45|nr:30S ribosomal protein S14 [Brochothrix campestris]